jgi:hypothetical protein
MICELHGYLAALTVLTDNRFEPVFKMVAIQQYLNRQWVWGAIKVNDGIKYVLFHTVEQYLNSRFDLIPGGYLIENTFQGAANTLIMVRNDEIYMFDL